MFRTSLVRVARQPARPFSTTPAVSKTITEKVKDTLKAADRTVSDAAVDGINKGAAAAETIKKTAGMSTDEAASKAKASAEELRGKASGAAAEAKGQAKGAAAQAEGTLKGAAENVKGKM